jgi:hypothetical protein
MADQDLGNFADLANTKVGDVEAPKAAPTGHYKVLITGMWKPHKAKSGNQAMRFPFRPIEAGDDVDMELLDAAGGLPLKDGSGKEREFYYDFWMSPDARFRFTDFVKAMGISDQLNLIEAAQELANLGTPFLLEAKHEYPKDAGGNDDLTKQPFLRWDNPTALEG